MNNQMMVGFFTESQIESLVKLLAENGCPAEVIGGIWQAWDWKDGDMLHKAIVWAWSQTLPE